MAKETSEEKTIRKAEKKAAQKAKKAEKEAAQKAKKAEKKAAQKAKKAAEKISTIPRGIGGTGAAPRKVK